MQLVLMTTHWKSISYRFPSFFSHPLLFLEMLTMPFNKSLRDTINTALATRTREFGYFAVQSTKPQTIGYSHADSPAGLLAWMYEKLVRITDEYSWTDDEGELPSPPFSLCSPTLLPRAPYLVHG